MPYFVDAVPIPRAKSAPCMARDSKINQKAATVSQSTDQAIHCASQPTRAGIGEVLPDRE